MRTKCAQIYHLRPQLSVTFSDDRDHAWLAQELILAVHAGEAIEERKTVATFVSMELYETGSSSDPWLALHS